MLGVSGPIAYGIVAENMPQKDMKVCFLGSYCVGKTSITQRFVKGRFDEEYISTIGAAFLSKSLFFQNIEYRFALWDTAGQERFRSLAPLTYRSAAAALIVYDITKQDSFDEVDFWLSELRREGPEGILIYVIGNKVDLEAFRVVDQEVAEKFAQTKGAFHFHTSAKTGQGVEEMFFNLCQMDFTKTTLKENGCMHHQNTIDVSNSTNSDVNNGGHRDRCRCRNT
nr:ras-related protein Rab-31-like [Lytechinus pictus]